MATILNISPQHKLEEYSNTYVTLDENMKEENMIDDIDNKLITYKINYKFNKDICKWKCCYAFDTVCLFFNIRIWKQDNYYIVEFKRKHGDVINFYRIYKSIINNKFSNYCDNDNTLLHSPVDMKYYLNDYIEYINHYVNNTLKAHEYMRVLCDITKLEESSKYITSNLIHELIKFINNTKVTHCLYTDSTIIYTITSLANISEYMSFDATNIHYVSEYECVNEIFNREKSRLMENLNKIETKQ